MTPPEKLEDVPWVAEVLDQTPSWVYANCAAKKLPHVKIGKYLRFRPSAIAKFVDEHSVQATPVGTKR